MATGYLTSTTAAAFSQGWLLMAGLIVAIGAQNAWVLRQGLRGGHVGAVVATCVIADVSLTVAGVFGLGAALAASPARLEVLRHLGVAFLLAYAGRAAWRAWRGGDDLRPAAAAELAAEGAGRVVAVTLAVTLLNPHVYLDTVLLVGSIGAAFPPDGRVAFASGAGLASLMWFAVLGFGARALAPWLQRPATWRVLEGLVAAVMIVVAARLWWQPL